MFAKIVILCVAFAATSASLVGTGTSAGSRVMDGHGNYAFQYGIASAGAKRSRSEVGSGYAGPIKTSYTVADSHIAPAAPLVAHAAAPVVAAAPLGYAGLGGLGYGAGLGHGYGGYGGYGYGAGLGYGLGHGGYGGYGAGYGAGVLGHGGLGYGAGYGYGGYGGYGLYGAGKHY